MNIPSIKTETTQVEDTVEVSTDSAATEVTQPEVTQPEVVTAPEVAQSVEGAFTGNDRVPALWAIIPTEDGIEASNGTTGSRFVGSIADFNAKLKG